MWTTRAYDCGMPQRRSTRAEDVFLVRIWCDDDRPNHAPWRASVTHVTTSERHYFTDYGDLCEFLERCRRKLPG
ncbi:MAG: hypothetical protein KGN02_01025 [bacterium]|nr:hypothetical protein [bacterium]